jgi:hypothetical protein
MCSVHHGQTTPVRIGERTLLLDGDQIQFGKPPQYRAAHIQFITATR